MLKGIKHFSQNVRRIWFVAVSKLGKTDLVFVQPGAKINSVYDSVRTYSKQGLLPAIRRISNNFFVFKQDEAPCTPFTTLSPTCISTVSEFIETENRPPNSPDLTPADYSETQSVQRCSRCNATKFQTLISWRKFWSTPGLTEARTHWTERLIRCHKGWRWLSRQRVVMLNFVWMRLWFTVFSMKIEQNSCVIVKFNAILGVLTIYAKNRQRIFNCTDMQIIHFILDKILKLLTYYTPFNH